MFALLGTLKAQIYAVVLAAVLASVIGAWVYVRHLQSRVETLQTEKERWASAAREFERQAKAQKLQAEVNDATTTVVQNALRAAERARENLAADLAAALERLRRQQPAARSAPPVVSSGPAGPSGGTGLVVAPGPHSCPPVEPDPAAERFVQQVSVECVAAAFDADERAAVIRGWQRWYTDQRKAWEAK